MIHQILPLKTTDELLSWISENYDVAPLPLSYFSAYFMQAFKFTIMHSVRHESNQGHGDQLNFIAYSLLQTERNQKYFDSCPKKPEEAIYLLLETENKCLTSNCHRLHLEVHLAWGLSEYDRKNRTLLWKEYIFVMDSLAKLDAEQDETV